MDSFTSVCMWILFYFQTNHLKFYAAIDSYLLCFSSFFVFFFVLTS